MKPPPEAAVRVGFDGRTLGDHFPGIGRYAYNLARALLERPSQPELTLFYDPGQAHTRFDPASLPGAKLVVAAPAFALLAQWRLPRQLRRQAVDVYHSPYYIMPYWPGVPAVVTLHDLIPMRYPAYYTPLARLVFAASMRLAARTANRIIAISQATADDLQRTFGLRADRVSVIHEAPDPRFTLRTAPEIEPVRRRLGLPARFLLYFGSNKPHKNLPRLVEAYLGLGRIDVPLVIAGHWDPRYPQAKVTAEKAGALDRVLFLGPIADSDLSALYSAALAFVFPSEYEGFGLPPLEAMACGTPVACSDASSLPEVVGEAALQFDPREVETIRGGLEQLLGQPSLRDQLRERGLARARQFTWAAAAERTLAVYEAARSAA